MSKRVYLKKNEKLLLGDFHGLRKPALFTIEKKVGSGGFAVCYDAVCGKVRGKLKEFYPLEEKGYILERKTHICADGTKVKPLFPVSGPINLFEKDCDEYTRPYNTLLEEISRNAENIVFNTFIPGFEIFFSCDEKGEKNGSVYIWTPSVPIKTFDEICKEIHQNPSKEPEKKLYLVLNSVKNLAECICALHCAELIHGDIKPENFGFHIRNDKVLTESISLFDVNSVYSIYNTEAVYSESKGYTAPEIGTLKPDNKADIYSIGATLFSAIVVNDNNETGYSNEYYNNLDKMVAASKLIESSEANSHPVLRALLVKILKKCLNPDREKRYKACEALIADLEKAITRFLPADIVKRIRMGEVVGIKEINKVLDKKNPTLVFQNLLYEKPLYACVPKGEKAINVLVVGFGGYAQSFLDVCLPTGQMAGMELNVTVVSNNKEDKELYLKDRPELDKFFNIDGSLEKSKEESYGNISFVDHTFVTDKGRQNKDEIVDVIVENNKIHYVFIALGDDELNHTVAKTFVDSKAAFGLDYCVNFAYEGKPFANKGRVKGNPVYINEDITKKEFYGEIERMAFNAHLIWENGLNVDYQKIRKKFSSKYNHASCVSNVLSIKYKLYSVGIDLDKCTFAQAAKRFVREIWNDKSRKNDKNQLICTEHKRWVVEKLCNGWTCRTDYSKCMNGSINDKRAKKHVCIVRSTPELVLIKPEYISNNCRKWDEATEKEIAALDGLDRVSVMLHRAFAAKAEEIKNENILSGEMIASIQRVVECSPDAAVAFSAWISCLKDIWNNDLNSVDLYEGLLADFKETLKFLEPDDREYVKSGTEAIITKFWPILKSTDYKDYKKNDFDMTKYIPFILTYSEEINLAIPFSTGSNTEIFNNVAAATVLNPSRITYLYLAEKQCDLESFEEAAGYVKSYIQSKNLKTYIDFMIAYTKPGLENEIKELSKRLKEGEEKVVKSVKAYPVESRALAAKVISESLKKLDGERKICAIEENSTNLSYLLLGAGVYGDFDKYQFDTSTRKFHSMTENCEFFGYVENNRYVRVNDMAAFKNSKGRSHDPEFFNDYKKLWEAYRKDSFGWKMTCELLCEYSALNDVIGTFEVKPKSKMEARAETYSYIMPFVCYPALNKITQMLKDCKIIEDESEVRCYTTDSCRWSITEKNGCRKDINRIVENPYALMVAENIQFKKVKRQVEVCFDNLVVNKIKMKDFPNFKNAFSQICDVLRFFAKNQFISNLRIEKEENEDVISFCYATLQIKQLMTTAGRILEIYTFHKLLECGCFDDVESSFEVNWENSNVLSEIDCVVTKGFKSLFIECKARPVIEQDYYFKLSKLAEKFGINATAVLIADTQENPRYDNSLNNMQRTRGSMLDVITISNPDEINNIGHTLLKIIDGK